MTARDRLLKALKDAAETGDTEQAHSLADDALLDYIDDEEIRVAYEAVPKRYA